MLTKRFAARKKELEKIFTKKNLVDTWRGIVRDRLRTSDLKDLFDYYDFNYNIEQRALTVKNSILNGKYRVEQPLIYRLEKKYGICRHLVIPNAIDALVLQVLVESVADKVIDKQPSKNAFYSRDKHNVPKPHEVSEYGLSWRQQWKKLQKQIYKFSDEKELIIATDLSNYYDTIDIQELRKVFSSLTEIGEVINDILFRIIEEISWKPDYLPYSWRGLPTTNIEAVRLLAHSFLFEIDNYLKSQSGNSFARWMDDIVIGVSSRKEAIEVLSSLSDMLKSRGLALNLSKTKIYDEKNSYYNFQIEQNRYLDKIEKVKPGHKDYRNVLKEVNKRFKNHFKDQNPKYWDKVTKRYITTYSNLNSPKLLDDIDTLYVEYPIIRMNLLYYLVALGYSKKACSKVLKIIDNIDIFDDVSMYQLCYLVTQWEVPVNAESKTFLSSFEEKITTSSFKRKNPIDFYYVLWFKAKYNHPDELHSFIKKWENLWQSDNFLRRQVTAVLSRVVKGNDDAKNILSNQLSSGVLNTVTLAEQIKQFSKLETLDKKLNPYLFPNNIQRPYPLGKFLVLCSVLNSEKIRDNKTVHAKIKKHIHDPYYLKWLDSVYNIS